MREGVTDDGVCALAQAGCGTSLTTILLMRALTLLVLFPGLLCPPRRWECRREREREEKMRRLGERHGKMREKERDRHTDTNRERKGDLQRKSKKENGGKEKEEE